MTVSCPCSYVGHTQRKIAWFGNNASVVHYNGLKPQQKYIAAERQELWFLQNSYNPVQRSSEALATCSAHAVASSYYGTLSRRFA